MNDSLLHTQSLKVGYGGHCVVDGVDIDALRGSMICLLGPNGSGKSTILRTLSGMLDPVGGTVYLEDIEVPKIRKSKLARRMAVVLTNRLQPGLMTAFEIAAMGRHPYTGFFGKLRQADIDIVYTALRSVKAEYLADRYYDELSDGEKQKIMIARALAQEPEVIVLDEPTSHLDISHRVDVVEILARQCRERRITVIMALHDIDLALKACQVVLLVKNGRIVAQGPPEQIVSQGVVQDLYEISGAEYNDLLGSLEIGSHGRSDLFITGGAGSGIPVFRALRRAGFGMDCGVLHQSDVDAHVAKALCNRLVTESDFQFISDQKYREAYQLMQSQRVVVDTGFPTGETNKKNSELLVKALESGKQVFTLRSESEGFYPDNGQRPIYCQGVSDLVENIKSLDDTRKEAVR